MMELHLTVPTINGIALLVWFVMVIIAAVLGYCCGRSDGRDKERSRCLEILESSKRKEGVK